MKSTSTAIFFVSSLIHPLIHSSPISLLVSHWSHNSVTNVAPSLLVHWHTQRAGRAKLIYSKITAWDLEHTTVGPSSLSTLEDSFHLLESWFPHLLNWKISMIYFFNQRLLWNIQWNKLQENVFKIVRC